MLQIEVGEAREVEEHLLFETLEVVVAGDEECELGEGLQPAQGREVEVVEIELLDPEHLVPLLLVDPQLLEQEVHAEVLDVDVGVPLHSSALLAIVCQTRNEALETHCLGSGERTRSSMEISCPLRSLRGAPNAFMLGSLKMRLTRSSGSLLGKHGLPLQEKNSSAGRDDAMVINAPKSQMLLSLTSSAVKCSRSVTCESEREKHVRH